MKTMKTILGLAAIALLTGCGPYNGNSVIVECVDERIIVKVYRAALVGKYEDIKLDQHLKVERMVPDISCKNVKN